MTECQSFFTTKEAANFLRFSPATLAIWRSEGRGPSYAKIGAAVRYQRTDMEIWAYASGASRRALEISSECHKNSKGTVKRPRGRVGAVLRARRLAAEPLCRDCLLHDSERPSQEIDHIIPLSKGGSDDDANVRCLCKGCHAARTRMAYQAEVDA